MKDIHPFEPFIPENASKLIIGTIPPHRFCLPNKKLKEGDIDFYYGSRDNYFWEILYAIFNDFLTNSNFNNEVEQRKDLLREYGIGITDLIQSCEREKYSAMDNALHDIKHKDLKSILEKHAQINTLIYTSEFVKKHINIIFESYHSIDKLNRKHNYLKIFDKEYDAWILYSPSGNGSRRLGKNGKNIRFNQYKDIFTRISKK